MPSARRITTGVKLVSISNLRCVVKYELNNDLRYVILKIFTRLRPGYIEKRIENIDLDTFNISELLSRIRLQIQSQWNKTLVKPIDPRQRPKSGSVTIHSSVSQEISHELLSSATVSPRMLERETLPRMTFQDEMESFKGILTAEVVDSLDDMFMSNDKDDLFYKVPQRIISFIDGCPSLCTTIHLKFDDENDRIIFCANEHPEEKDRFTISVAIEKLFKLMTVEGLKLDQIEDQLFAMNDRNSLIIRAISIYLQKNVRIQVQSNDEEEL